ncbi:YncE family protein [Povalibacter sp.]|uniref:YncE family protein n=1 Tax=Povalibacter sp. TaxID=1962978 RepID=UPI002F4189D1
MLAVLALLLSLPAPAAELLVLNKGDATLSFIEPSTGRTLKTIGTGEGPHEIELSADGRLAVVSNYGASVAGNTLSVIDVPERVEIRRVDLGELLRPHGLSFSGGQAYFTSEASKRVARFDPASQRVDWQFETGQEGTHMVLASHDGQKLFAANMGSNTVSIIARGAEDEWQQALVAVGAGPEGLDQSPDGRQLWTAHSRDGRVSIIDIASAKVVDTFDAGTRRSNRLKFTRDGKRVLISDLAGGELVIIDVASRAEQARLALGAAPTGILIAPDGRNAYVAVSGANRIAVIDLALLKVSRTIDTGKSPDGMAWLQ